MDIKVNGEAANQITQSIVSAGQQFTEFVEVAVTGANTNEVEAAYTLGSKVQSIFLRYQAVVSRDGEQITVLANCFEDVDRDNANQMRDQLTAKV